MSPIASKNGTWTNITDALFTSTSATCITGLTTYDTYTHWSLFGQIIILILIQIGGLGFMTIATIFSFALKRKIGMNERYLLKDSVSGNKISGVVRLTKHILFGTLLFEVIGASLLAFRFIPEMGLLEGIYYAIFHAISAFCQAGFDLMGKYNTYTSLIPYSNDPYVLSIIIGLVIIGGLGFTVWEDLFEHRCKFRKYTLHTKIILVSTIFLITLPSIIIFFAEQANTLIDKALPDQIANTIFQAVAPRTAGFSAVNLSELSDSTIVVTIFLMIIGGAPGSTAGGIKITTFVIFIAATISTLRNQRDVNIFKRHIDNSQLKKAVSIVVLYFSISLCAILLISSAQTIPLKSTVFEVFSAIGTVGASLGITNELSVFSKYIIILLMFLGRVGILSLTLAFKRTTYEKNIRYVNDDIAVG